jgi:hypothetical protein
MTEILAGNLPGTSLLIIAHPGRSKLSRITLLKFNHGNY